MLNDLPRKFKKSTIALALTLVPFDCAADSSLLGRIAESHDRVLQMFALSGDSISPQFSAIGLRSFQLFGFGRESGAVQIEMPTLDQSIGYDSNFNSGYVHKTISYDGVEFQVDPQYWAQPAVFLEGRFSLIATKSFSREESLKVSYSVLRDYSLGSDSVRRYQNFNLCLNRIVGDRHFHHACLDYSSNSSGTGGTSSTSLTYGIDRYTRYGHGVSRFGVGVGLDFELGGNPGMRTAEVFIDASILDTRFQNVFLQVRARSSNSNALTEEFAMSIGSDIDILGNPTRIDLERSHLAGGDFLGIYQLQNVMGVNAKVSLSPSVVMKLSASKTSSSVAIFGGKRFSLGFDLKF